MITGLLSFLIYLIVVALLIGLVWWIVGMIPLPAPFGQILRVAVVVIACIIVVLMLLNLVDGGVGPYRLLR